MAVDPIGRSRATPGPSIRRCSELLDRQAFIHLDGNRYSVPNTLLVPARRRALGVCRCGDGSLPFSCRTATTTDVGRLERNDLQDEPAPELDPRYGKSTGVRAAPPHWQ
jgi:hypothetical protein